MQRVWPVAGRVAGGSATHQIGLKPPLTGQRFLLDHLITYLLLTYLLLLTGVSLHPPAPKGGPTRTSADVSVPRLAGFSLIT